MRFVVVAPTCGLRSGLRQRGMAGASRLTQDFILGYCQPCRWRHSVLGYARADCLTGDLTRIPKGKMRCRCGHMKEPEFTAATASN